MGASAKAVAVANNDYVHVAWDFGRLLEDCGGFAVYRITKDASADGVALPSFARNPAGKRLHLTCKDRPIRKYSWRDVSVTRGGTYRYRVVAMRGPNVPLPRVPALMTSWITVSPHIGKAQVYFNRGILATQRISDTIWDPSRRKPDFAQIETLINDNSSALRKSLSGQLFEALTILLDRAAKEGGSCWASLYELTDPYLIERLCECTDLHLILANNDDVRGKQKIYDGKNQPAAKKLGKTARELIRRYMPSGQIGHNKFVVYLDSNRQAKAVLSGSTNWTASGLCTQSNNAILIESEELAEQYLAYWNDLKADAIAAGIPKKAAPMKTIQGKDFRGECALRRTTLGLNGTSTVTVSFSPNTLKRVGKTTTKTAISVPDNMAELYRILAEARQSVLFLAFMPGKAGSVNSHHFLQELGKLAAEKPGLFVRGAVSDPGLTREFDLAAVSAKLTEDSMISSPQGIFRNFREWRSEIYKYGHAIVHDKIIVVDPFDPKRCVVVTGSHNLGFRASSNNDENMLIIRGDADIARSYAAHVMDIFEHYRSRWISAGKKPGDYDPITDPKWQQRYFDPWRPAFAERLFWVSEGKPLPALEQNPKLRNAQKKLARESAERNAASEARKAARKARSTVDGVPSAERAIRKKTVRKRAASGKTVRKRKSPHR